MPFLFTSLLSMKTLKIKAPAKLNVRLKVTGRRPDGYHELVSIMIPIDLFDLLEPFGSPALDGSFVFVQTDIGLHHGFPSGYEKIDYWQFKNCIVTSQGRNVRCCIKNPGPEGPGLVHSRETVPYRVSYGHNLDFVLVLVFVLEAFEPLSNPRTRTTTSTI